MIDQKKISYTIGDGRKVVTDFDYSLGKTKVTTVFDAETELPVDVQKEGWQFILNNF